MKTTLNIPQELIAEAMQLADSRTKTEAVRLALEMFIRQKRIEVIIAHAGSLQFSNDWEKGRHAR